MVRKQGFLPRRHEDTKNAWVCFARYVNGRARTKAQRLLLRVFVPSCLRGENPCLTRLRSARPAPAAFGGALSGPGRGKAGPPNSQAHVVAPRLGHAGRTLPADRRDEHLGVAAPSPLFDCRPRVVSDRPACPTALICTIQDVCIKDSCRLGLQDSHFLFASASGAIRKPAMQNSRILHRKQSSR
jgi:hypothetical protein